MNFSAASSSSLVVTPGRALERSIRRQRAWILPASAISSICADVLRMIMPRYMIQTVSYLHLLFATQRADQGVNPLLHLVRRQLSVHRLQDAAVLVVINQRLGLLAILGPAVLDPLGPVVLADGQLGPVDVADTLLLRRVELEVVDVAGVLLAGATTAETAQDLIRRDVDQDHCGDHPSQLLHLRVQRLGLGNSAGETVKDKAVGGLLVLEALGDHPDGHLVRDQVPAIHVLLGLLADLGPLLDRRAQDVAGRVIGQPEVLLPTLHLCPLAAPGRSEQDEVQLGQARRSAARVTSGSPRSCASSAGLRAA